MEGRYNLRSPAVKRLMREAKELAEATEQYFAQPLEDNLFEWHFTIRGPSDSDFTGGVYHGRIILPPDYPMKPPSIMFLTANGRFDCFTKICLSISKHHPESWQPSWSIRTALLAIIGFMPSPGHGAIGSLDYTPTERHQLAKRSKSYKCEICGPISEKILPLTSKSNEAKEEMMNLAAQLSMVGEKSKTSAASSQQETVGDSATLPSAPPTDSEAPADTPPRPVAELRQRHTEANTPETGADIRLESVPSATSTTPTGTDNVQTNSPDIQTIPAAYTPGNTQPVSDAATRRSGNSVTLNRGGNSCSNSVTYWALVIVGIVLGLLLIRRFIMKFGSVFDMDSADDL